uniref:hypothetical protein n=1 Tax=Pseudoalteromonas translucida TaxID=166935 RepID=UPI0015EFC678|nr:hypothetical protein [Pseudoalteromonas translucida]
MVCLPAFNFFVLSCIASPFQYSFSSALLLSDRLIGAVVACERNTQLRHVLAGGVLVWRCVARYSAFKVMVISIHGRSLLG